MRKRLIKVLVISLIASLSIGLMASVGFADEEKLTPKEWNSLGWQDKLEYKTIVIRSTGWGVGDWMEEKDLPTDVTNLQQKIYSGDLTTPYNWYNVSLFSIAYPEVYVKPVTFNPYTPDVTANLSAKMAAGNAPSVFNHLIPIQTVSGGLAADITDLATEEWANLNLKPWVMNIWKQYMFQNGRAWAIPGEYSYTGGVSFRKDFFKESGIFDAKGNPGPPEEWTWQDFREIAKKLTDPKKQRWGVAYNTLDTVALTGSDWVVNYILTAGWPISGNFRLVPPFIFPNKSGETTWKTGYIPLIGEAFKFFNEMRAKDNSMLIEQNYKPDPEWSSGRTAMYLGGSDLQLLVSMGVSNRFDPEKTSQDCMAAAPIPTSEYGIEPRCLGTDPFIFDGTLNKEELEAAFNWATWNLSGLGYENSLNLATQQQSVGLDYGLWGTIVAFTHPYEIEVPDKVQKALDKLTRESPELWAEFKAVRQREESRPLLPSATEYGLVDLEDIAEVQERMIQLRYPLLTMKDVTLDKIEEMMEESAEAINNKMLNYKIEGDEEKFQAYFEAMDSYYKENYPKFYGSKGYEENFVRYFKF